MRTSTIKKDRHYSNFSLPKLFFSTKKIVRTIECESCRYDLQSEDQLDTNKLFSIGYLPSHQFNSVRFGWRYDLSSAKMEIIAYWYKEKTRYIEPMLLVDIGARYTYSITIEKDKHLLTVTDSTSRLLATKEIQLSKRLFGYYLKPFFGGNRTSPQQMTIKFY